MERAATSLVSLPAQLPAGKRSYCTACCTPWGASRACLLITSACSADWCTSPPSDLHMLQIDANKNGSLEAREVERLLMTIADDASQIITHKTVRSAMDRLDTNKDKRITFDEFIRVSLELLDTAAWAPCWSSLQAATHDQ